MSNLIIVAIVVSVLALAAIPAAIRAQANDTVQVNGRVQFLENGKVLHDTGLPVKKEGLDSKSAPKESLKDNVTEKVALDCSQVDIEAMPQSSKGLPDKGVVGGGAGAGKVLRATVRSNGADCAYELRLPAGNASYKVALAVVGFTNGGPGASKVALKGAGELTELPTTGWNLVKNVDGGGTPPSTGKLPLDTKTAKRVSVKAIGPDIVVVSDGKDGKDGKAVDTKASEIDLKKTPDSKSLPSVFRAVPTSVDFAVDIQE